MPGACVEEQKKGWVVRNRQSLLVEDLLADAIKRIHFNESVSKLFE